MTNSESMATLMTYAYNFNYDFIKDCWKDDKSLVDHLNGKWADIANNITAINKKVGGWPRLSGTDIWFRFYMELDQENKDKLNQYILYHAKKNH